MDNSKAIEAMKILEEWANTNGVNYFSLCCFMDASISDKILCIYRLVGDDENKFYDFSICKETPKNE